MKKNTLTLMIILGTIFTVLGVSLLTAVFTADKKEKTITTNKGPYAKSLDCDCYVIDQRLMKLDADNKLRTCIWHRGDIVYSSYIDITEDRELKDKEYQKAQEVIEMMEGSFYPVKDSTGRTIGIHAPKGTIIVPNESNK